ncbi:MAG TPA: bifunctional YncE family protein/alkaline phosphatase family protein [Streptosporangiaceae bacterium]|jgi:YVTN family beta-propeller protein
MRVTRRRRSDSGVRDRVVRGRSGRRVRIIAAGTAALTVVGGGAYGSTRPFGENQVGTAYRNGIQVSSDQIIKPIGDRLLTQYGKFMGSTASPDGKHLAVMVSAWGMAKPIALIIVDLDTYKVQQTVGTDASADLKIGNSNVGQDGPDYSPDGKTLWLPQTDGYAKFTVNADGTLSAPTTVAIAKQGTKQALPSKAAFSPDGSTVYATVNGQNRVVAIDAASGAIKQSWDVGIAPRGIVRVGDKLYVSNEGGRQAKSGDKTINSYGTNVPADPVRGTSTTGTVSVIDTADPSAPVASVPVGLHPTAMHAAGHALFVANTFDDSVSVIDTTKDKVVQTIETKPWPSSTVGYEPDDVTLTSDGHLLVSLGRANAVAVYRYHGDAKAPVNFVGLLPTDYYPSDITTAGGKVVVTNRRGIDARGPKLTFDKGTGTTPATGYGTHATTGTLTRFGLPSDQQIARYTGTVFAQNGWGGNDVEKAKGHPAKAVAVPQRVGDPSTIKHVFLLVKENRTYDQVFGDDPRGNGDPTLTQFGEKATPNQHALAKQFGLYDNFYDVGTNSAEGHNWVMQGDNPEYTESNSAYLRSYDTEDDVLGHQRSGFLWTAAQAAGRTARDFGEFTQFETKPAGATWQKYYCTTKSVENGGDPSQLTDPSVKQDTESPIPSLNAITDHDFPKFDTDIPDTYRYQIWKQNFEKNGPANLNMFWLSSDHTGGPPDPEAQVADNDLAVGRITDEISHSKYWKDSAIFVVEDDSQDGADHVDGHRAPVEVISPWAQHGKVDSTYYSQITMVRTIEQILGAQPLNQKVAAATPMYGAFTRKPDYRPFDAKPNQIPLTEGIATAPDCGLDTLGKKGAAAKTLNDSVAKKVAVPSGMRNLAVQWEKWSQSQRLTGNYAIPDYANPAQMNRWTWYRTHDWKTPYPGDTKIYAPSDVPAGYLPSPEVD